MATKKSTRKITDEQINDISYEITHIETLVQILIPELPADNQTLDSGLMLIDGQAKKIQGMLADAFGKAAAHDTQS